MIDYCSVYKNLNNFPPYRPNIFHFLVPTLVDSTQIWDVEPHSMLLWEDYWLLILEKMTKNLNSLWCLYQVAIYSFCERQRCTHCEKQLVHPLVQTILIVIKQFQNCHRYRSSCKFARNVCCQPLFAPHRLWRYLIVIYCVFLATFQTITSRLITGDPNAFQIDETKVPYQD